MPWQRPYQCYHAFNWKTLTEYRGINRIMLPFGQYLTGPQLNQINKEMKEDFRFQKGIKWYPIVKFINDKKDISRAEVVEKFGEIEEPTKPCIFGRDNIWNYGWNEGYFKQRNRMMYYEVADIKYFKNSRGETLPSRLGDEAVLSSVKPNDVINGYVGRSGVKVDWDYAGVPCYIPAIDTVAINRHQTSQEFVYSTVFHELAHSTGAAKRLNRQGVTRVGVKPEEKKDVYAKEECIAEIAASLLCADCDVYSFQTSECREYENNLAYVSNWKKRIKDWGSSFIYIVSQAEQAYNYIMGEGSEDD